MKYSSGNGFDALKGDEFDYDIEANTPSLTRTGQKSLRGRFFASRSRGQEVIELDEIPAIIKSANGNIFWADEQCTRRVGPTSSEARLFLKLLQMNEPEMLSYGDYKEMFDDFSRERKMLQNLVAQLPWWRAFRKKKIWKARIQWLESIREPRLWLLYLMARRRRILQQAAVAIMIRLKEKSLVQSESQAISLQNLAAPGPSPRPGIGEMSVYPDRHINSTNAEKLLQEYKKKIEAKFGAKSLQEVLANYLTNSEQESLAQMTAGGVDGTLEKANPKSPAPNNINIVQLDGPMSPHQELPTRPKTSREISHISEVISALEQNSTPSKSAISSVARGVRSSLRSSISRSRARPRGWSNSSEKQPRIPGRCPIFNMRFQATREDIKKQVEKLMPRATPYIVIGWFLRSASDPRELILQFDEEELLFESLRQGTAEVRGWRRFLSLKTLKGFGLYKCEISRGAHIPLILSTSQKIILSQFFLAFQASYRHSDDAVARAWQGWVQKNLNDNKDNPLEGKYSLQLIYDWSSYRLSVIVAAPILLSLAIGFWYTTADVGAAWTVAAYIISAAALLAALIAIIGSLKDT